MADAVVVPVDRYLERIGFRGAPWVDLETLEELMVAHMLRVPFENIDVYHGIDVTTDVESSLTKIVDRNRGGWCFEVNGAFAALLETLGFDVKRIGAAVLLSGPSAVIDHLCMEVTLDEPYLVDVGFGDGFVRPLPLNRRGRLDGGVASFELLPSPEGTTLTRIVDDVPAPQYRFSRVERAMADFEPASRRLQDDKSLSWHTQPFATRLIEANGDRVTLRGERLKVVTAGAVDSSEVADGEWSATLHHWFDIAKPIDDSLR